MYSKIWTGARFIAAVAMSYGLWGSASVAVAQNCGAGCGPLVGNSCAKRASDCGWLGLKIYPRMESRYIRQFCGPHICPGSCFGYFKPKITRWNEACPNYGEPAVDQFVAAPTYQSQQPTTPAVIETAPEPKAKIPPISDSGPKPMPKLPDVTAPDAPIKPPSIPAKPPTTGATPLLKPLEQGLVIPPVPEVPVLPVLKTVGTTAPGQF